MEKNRSLITTAIERRLKVYLGSPETAENLWDATRGRPTVFATELQQLLDAGYVRQGSYLVPGP